MTVKKLGKGEIASTEKSEGMKLLDAQFNRIFNTGKPTIERDKATMLPVIFADMKLEQ